VSFAFVSSLALVAVLMSPSVVLAEGVCPNEAFRVGSAAALPDCRAYEMVTPVFKNVGDVTNESKTTVWGEPMAGSAGQSLTIWSDASFAGAAGNTTVVGSPYMLSRTGSGWTTTSMEVPESQFLTIVENRHPAFGGSLDGQTEALMARGVSQPGNSIEAYRVGTDGSVVEIGPALPPTVPYEDPTTLAGEENGAGLHPEGMSADGSHVFFHTTRLHWPFDETESGSRSLYEYAGTGNTEPMLVGVGNDGRLISTCGTYLGGSNKETRTEMYHNAISTDGRTVFFTTTACGSAAEVYARIDNGLADGHTVAISEPSREDCEECDTSAPSDAIFEGASADGSKVFLSTYQALLGSDTSQNLYEYDFNAPAGHRLIRVSGGDATVLSPMAGVIGEPAAVSEDGSHVYFGASGVLTRMPNDQGQVAQAGAANLYVFERDARYPAGHTAFIAQLSPEDGEMFQREGFASGSYPHGADATPDGRFLVFLSVRDLTPDDTSTVPQVFEYDSLTERLVRVSIGQNGFKDNGNTSVYPAEIPSPLHDFKEPTVFVADPRVYWSHLAVSADGAYVFFSSHNALTPNAPVAIPKERLFGNRPVFSYDTGPTVYEYHAGNVYLIARPGHTGSLRNDGTSGGLISTDVSGADVFFGSTEQLVGQDTDTNGDIYDARVGGGFPALVSPPVCSGDACQGALAGAPVLLSPGSEFQAGGNPPLASRRSGGASAKKKAKPKKKKRRKAGRRARSGRRHSSRRSSGRGRG
jgi:hypothetical protein